MKRVSKILSLAIMCALVMAPMTVFAADQEVTTAQTVTATVSTASSESGSESGSGSGSESGSEASVFVVAIPQTITLNRTTYQTFSGTYQTGVKAVLAPGKKVTVTPAGTFDMTNTSDGTTKYSATVTQEKTTWVGEGASPASNELTAGVDTYTNSRGSITVDIKKAGAYSGSLGFTVALQ